MHKKRGFTLIELLVVIALTMLIFATVGGTYIFMAQSQGDLLDKSSELFYAQNIADYLKSNDCVNKLKLQLYGKKSIDLSKDTSNENIRFTDGTLFNGEKTIYTNTNVESCQISSDGKFMTCILTFKSGETFDFIIGKINP